MMQTILINKQVDAIAESLQKKFSEFLQVFKVHTGSSDYNAFDIDDEVKSDEEFLFFYLKQAEKMKTLERRTMYVDMRHFFDFDVTYEYRDLILTEFARFEPYLNQSLEELMKKLYLDWASKKTFYLCFYNVPEVNRIRELRTSKIGKLISISATVTRTSEVRPELVSGSFLCKMCNSVVKNVDQQFRFTEPRICVNQNCNNRQKWELIHEESTFADWQKLRVQENPSDIPPGSMPRSLDVILRNELVEACKPGDKCIFSGCLLVVPDIISLLKPGEKVQHQLKRDAVRKEEQKPMDGVSGLKNLGLRDMTYKLIFIAHFVEFPDSKLNPFTKVVESSCNQSKEMNKKIHDFNDSELQEILKMKNQQNIYLKLTRCISPSVYGHDEVKRGILLMLFGGVNKSTSEGIKLRGDLNICIVGDPSTAKSQFLKYVCQLLPRAVYTSGKGSSAAGLTASVMRDTETGEFCIEAGALMLADNGICCIDEFDKMDQKDQVAIHEAMEQQTISIAKAGIQATLMARTSVLAAANPLYGRYDKTKPLKSNIDISAPIMSRFDLFFVVVDERNDYADYQIAQHLVNLHRLHGVLSHDNLHESDHKLKESFKVEFTQEQLLLYLRFAKSLNPKFTKEAAEKLREEYGNLRQNDVSYQKSAYRITVRQLESLIRLSEALARVHLDENIHAVYVVEASRLLRKSIISVDMPNVELELDFERKLQEERRQYENDENVVMEGDEAQLEKKKIVISGADYEKLKTNIVVVIRDLEAQDIRVKHKDIVQFICEENFENLQDVKQTEELAEKINAVIERLINKEGILIITAENDDKSERILSLNVNYDASLY